MCRCCSMWMRTLELCQSGFYCQVLMMLLFGVDQRSTVSIVFVVL